MGWHQDGFSARHYLAHYYVDHECNTSMDWFEVALPTFDRHSV